MFIERRAPDAHRTKRSYGTRLRVLFSYPRNVPPEHKTIIKRGGFMPGSIRSLQKSLELKFLHHEAFLWNAVKRAFFLPT